MELELGAQTRAAQLVAQRIPDVMAPADRLRETVQSAATGFRGQSAGAFAEALIGWFEVVDRLPGVLGGYAADLAAVDEAVAQVDSRGAGLIGRSYGSGLNMGAE